MKNPPAFDLVLNGSMASAQSFQSHNPEASFCFSTWMQFIGQLLVTFPKRIFLRKQNDFGVRFGGYSLTLCVLTAWHL